MKHVPEVVTASAFAPPLEACAVCKTSWPCKDYEDEVYIPLDS
jgi:hypothetical protein